MAFNTNNRFLHPPIKLDFFPPIEEETAEINIHSDIIKASQHKFNNIKQENYSNPIPSYYYYKEPTQNLISNKFSEPINLSPPKILEERPLDKNSYQFENVKRADNMKSPLQYKENYSAIYSKSSIDTPYTDFLLKQRDRELNLTNEVNPQFYLNYEMFNSFGPTSSKPNYQNLRKELELESIALQFKAISDARNSPEYKEEAIALREIEEAIRNMLSTDDQLLVESMSKQDPNELEEIVRKIMNEKERRRKSSEIKEQNEMEEIVKMIILEKNQKENNFKNKTLSSMPQKDIFMDNESSMFPNNNTHKDEILNNHNHLLNESLNLQNEIKNHDPTKFPKEKFLSKKNSFDKIKLTSPLGKKSNLKIKPAKFEDLEEIFYHSPQSLQKSIVISPNGTPIKAENTPKNEVLSEIKPEFNDIFENLVTIQGKSQDYFEKSQEEIVELHGPIELLFEKHGENVNLVNSETKGRISYKKNSVELNLKEGKEENGERKKSKTMENPQGKIGMSKESKNIYCYYRIFLLFKI